MSQGDQYFDCGFRFLSHEANSALQALRAQYEVRLIETRHAIVHEGWVTTEAGRMISHSAQIRLVDVLVEMVETLYESAAKAYTSAVGSSEYKERVDYVEQQLLGYSLRRWAQLTHGLPMVQVDCDPVAGTAARSNEQLLSDTLTAHIQSKALKLELNMWKAEAAAQSGEFATGKLQSDPPANRPEAAGPHRVAKAATGEDHFLKFLDPDHLRQMGERFPELASVLPGIAGAASFIRDMEAAKAKAEIAFRQHEVAEKWGSWDLDREDIDTQVDRFGDFGTTYPWHPAGCEYVWEMASTYMRSAFGDYQPDKFESMAQLVIDVYSEKVYEEKLKSYEKALWITYEISKAEFQECARKRLDPLVRAECLNRWQKRSAAISPERVGGECSVGTAGADGKVPDGPQQEAQSTDGPPARTPAQPDENDCSQREGSNRFAALVAHLQEIMVGATNAPKRPAIDHLSEAGFLRIEAAVLEIEAKARDTILSSFATMLPSQEHTEIYEQALDSGDNTLAKWLTTLIFREYVGLPIFDVVAQECLETAPHTDMPACLEAAARFALAHLPQDEDFLPDLRRKNFKLYIAKSLRRAADNAGQQRGEANLSKPDEARYGAAGKGADPSDEPGPENAATANRADRPTFVRERAKGSMDRPSLTNPIWKVPVAQTGPIPIARLNGKVDWISSTPTTKPDGSALTPKLELQVAEVTLGERSHLRAEVEAVFGGTAWPTISGLLAPMRTYATKVFDVNAEAFCKAPSAEESAEAVLAAMVQNLLCDVLGREWESSPGEQVTRTGWQHGTEGWKGREFVVIAGNDPDPNCLYHDVVGDAITYRYRFHAAPPAPLPGEPPGINLLDQEWWQYIGLNERHNLAMAIKPYLEDRVAHWRFIHSQSAPATSHNTGGAARIDRAGPPVPPESGTVLAQPSMAEEPSPSANEPPDLASPGPDAAMLGLHKALPTTTEKRRQLDDLSTLKAQPAAILAPATSRNASGSASAEGIDRGTRLTIEIFPSTCSFIPEKLTWDVEEIVDRHEGNIRQAVLEVLNGLRSSPSTPAPLSLIFDAVTEMGTELFNAALFRLDWIGDCNPPDAFDRVADALYLDGLNFVVKKYESVVSEIPLASPVCEPALLDALRTEWLQIREETKRDVHESSMEVREAQGFGADGFAQLRAEAAGDVGATDQESRPVGSETTHGIDERKRPKALSAGEESALAAALSRIDAEILESIREVKAKGLGSSDPHAWAANVVRLWINQSINAVAQAWFSADLALEEYCMQIERVAWALHSKAIQHFMATCKVFNPSTSALDLRTEVNEDFRYVLAVRARGWCRRFNEKLLLYSAGGGRKGELFTESAAAFVKRSKAFVFEIPQQMMAQELENNGATPLGPTTANMGNTKHAEPQFTTADGLDGPSAVDHPNAGPAQTGSGTAQASIAIPRQEDIKEQPRKARKGDATLLDGKRLVNFETAEQYLGISDRQRQKLMSNGALIVEGQGQNRKITVESLKAYLPPEIPN